MEGGRGGGMEGGRKECTQEKMSLSVSDCLFPLRSCQRLRAC